MQQKGQTDLILTFETWDIPYRMVLSGAKGLGDKW